MADTGGGRKGEILSFSIADTGGGRKGEILSFSIAITHLSSHLRCAKKMNNLNNFVLPTDCLGTFVFLRESES